MMVLWDCVLLLGKAGRVVDNTQQPVLVAR